MDDTLDNLVAELEEAQTTAAPDAEAPAPLLFTEQPGHDPQPAQEVVNTETAWVDERMDEAPRRSADPFNGNMIFWILGFVLGLLFFLLWLSNYVYELGH